MKNKPYNKNLNLKHKISMLVRSNPVEEHDSLIISNFPAHPAFSTEIDKVSGQTGLRKISSSQRMLPLLHRIH